MRSNKKCSTCGENKDIKYFSFRTDTNKFRDQCKKCHKGYKTDKYDKIKNIKSLLKDNLKQCSKCKETKKLNEFNNDKSTITRKTSHCKNCISLRFTKEKLRDLHYKTRYKLELGTYDILYESLNGKCQICNRKFDKLYIDHCHITGIVRGLLCNKCNSGLGMLEDNRQYLENAISYLDKNNKLPINIPMNI